MDEPEHIMLRRQELNRQIKVMKDAQKVIRRDPDLMSVMSININDSDIANHGNEEPKETKKPESRNVSNQNSSNSPKLKHAATTVNHSSSQSQQGQSDNKKASIGNIFGFKK